MKKASLLYPCVLLLVTLDELPARADDVATINGIARSLPLVNQAA